MEIKKRKILFVSILLLLGGLLVSCSKVNDIRLNTLEKSLNRLEKNYKNYSPEKLKSEVEECEFRFDKLDQDKEKLSIAQKQRLKELKREYRGILFNISKDLIISDFSGTFKEVIELIKDILR